MLFSDTISCCKIPTHKFITNPVGHYYLLLQQLCVLYKSTNFRMMSAIKRFCVNTYSVYFLLCHGHLRNHKLNNPNLSAVAWTTLGFTLHDDGHLSGRTSYHKTSWSLEAARMALTSDRHLVSRGSGQLVPKTTRTQDNSYPGQLVPKTTRTSCHGYELSWVRVVLGTSCPGYELSWVRVVQIPL